MRISIPLATATSALLLGLGLFSGCVLDSAKDPTSSPKPRKGDSVSQELDTTTNILVPKPTITGFSLSNTTIAAGNPADIHGVVAVGTTKATVSYKVTPADANILVPASSTVSNGASLSGVIYVGTGTVTGSYTLTATATDSSGQITTNAIPFIVIAGSSNPGPTITGLSLSSDVLATGFSADIRGTVSTGTNTASVSYSLTPDDPNIIFPRPKIVQDGASLDGILTIGPAQMGVYQLTITLTDAAGKTSTKNLAFTVAGTPPTPEPTSQGTIQLGAQSAVPAAFLQIQETVTAWSGGAGKPYAKIDLVFGADAAGVVSLMAPYQANGDGYSLSAWTALNTTRIADVGIVQPNGAAVKSSAAAAVSSKVPVVQGHYYAAALANGTYALLHVTSLTGSGKTSIATVEVFE